MNMETYSFQREAGIETCDFSMRIGTYIFETDLWERTTCVPDYYLTYVIGPEPANFSPKRMTRNAGAGVARNAALTFMPPAFAPQFHNAPQKLRVAQCIFSEDAFDRITAKRWNETPKSFVDLHNRRVRDLVLLLKRELSEPGFDSAIMAESLGRVLMLEIARHFRNLQQTRSSGNKLSPWQLRRITDMVHENCGNGSTPSVSDLAAVCGVSPGHLMRSFRMSTGSTLLEFIDGVRLAKAKALLVGSTLPLKCIAADAGFPNATRFSERFKILTGERPSDFRARSRGAARCQ